MALNELTIHILDTDEAKELVSLLNDAVTTLERIARENPPMAAPHLTAQQCLRRMKVKGW